MARYVTGVCRANLSLTFLGSMRTSLAFVGQCWINTSTVFVWPVCRWQLLAQYIAPLPSESAIKTKQKIVLTERGHITDTTTHTLRRFDICDEGFLMKT